MFFFVLFGISFVTTLAHQTEESSSGSCKVPPYPKHGSYVATHNLTVVPGQVLDYVGLNITCDSGYLIDGKEYDAIFCVEGIWSKQITDCTRQCRLIKDSSVTYTCLLKDGEGKRDCKDNEPDGTIIKAECKPGYYTTGAPPHMKCVSGSWDYVATCLAECGRIPAASQSLILNGRQNDPPVPWNVAIYWKRYEWVHICGGALVTSKVVISAAHCFWSSTNRKLASPQQYAVAVGNKYRTSAHPDDHSTQISDVADIKVPSRFLGEQANYQDDLALVVLTTPVEYNAFVSPVCIDFDSEFERRQLIPGALGKVAGWGKDTSGKVPALVKVADVPYFPIDECITEAPPDFRQFITADKICVGSKTGPTGVCEGLGGAGLAFPDNFKGSTRYYLRGIISGSPRTENCTNFFNTVTQVSKHELFIKELLQEH